MQIDVIPALISEQIINDIDQMPLLFMRSELTLANPSIRKLWLLFRSPCSNSLELPWLFSLVETFALVIEQYFSSRGLSPGGRSDLSFFYVIVVERDEEMN